MWLVATTWLQKADHYICFCHAGIDAGQTCNSTNTESNQCVANATCDASNTCVCDNGFFQNSTACDAREYLIQNTSLVYHVHTFWEITDLFVKQKIRLVTQCNEIGCTQYSSTVILYNTMAVLFLKEMNANRTVVRLQFLIDLALNGIWKWLRVDMCNSVYQLERDAVYILPGHLA